MDDVTRTIHATLYVWRTRTRNEAKKLYLVQRVYGRTRRMKRYKYTTQNSMVTPENEWHTQCITHEEMSGKD